MTPTKLSLAVALLFAVCLLTTPSSVEAKKKLRIDWFEWPQCDIMAQLGKIYEKENKDVEIEVVCHPFGDWYSNIFRNFDKNTGADILLLDSQWIGEAADSGHLVEISDILDDLEVLTDNSDYFDQAVQFQSEFPPGSNEYWGMPFCGDVQVIGYRKSLFDKYDVVDVFDLEELLRVAQLIKKKEDINGFAGIWCGNTTKCYDALATVWLNFVFGMDGDIWDVDEYQVEGVLNTENVAKATKYAKELLETATDPNIHDYSFDEVTASICNGQSGMVAIWAAAASGFTKEAGCALHEDIEWTVFPGQERHSLTLGGMGMHISAYSKNIDGAKDFMRWAESQDTQRTYARLGGFSPRKSVLASGLFLKQAPWNAPFAVSYPLVKDLWQIPEFFDMLDILSSDLDKIMRGDLNIEKGLQRIAKKQQDLLDDKYPNGPPRFYDMQEIEDAALIAASVVAGIVIFLEVVCFLLVCLWRNHPVMLYSSPMFLATMIVGGMIMAASVFPSWEREPTDASCAATMWLACFGVVILLTPLLLKTYRICYIWRSSRKFKTARISSLQLLITLAIVAILTLVYLTIWQVVNPSEPDLNTDVGNDDDAAITCQGDNEGIWLGVYFGIIGCFLLAACVLAFLTRNVVTALRESFYIALIVYNIMFTSVICIPLIFGLRDQITVSYIIFALGIIWASAGSLGILLVPKLYAVLFVEGSGTISASNTMTHKTMTMSTPSGSSGKTFNDHSNIESSASDVRSENV